MLTLIVNTSQPNLAGLFIAEFIKKSINIKVEWKNENSLKINRNVLLNSNISICRYLARCVPEILLCGATCLEEVEIDHWISFGIGPLSSSQKFKDSIEYLNCALNSLTFLVGHQLTIADLLVWNVLFCNHNWNKSSHFDVYKNIKRWFLYVENAKEVKLVLNSLPEDFYLKLKGGKILENKDEGKFIELPNAKKGEVVVRFPPEASGYLHIGHAKAALLNQYYQELFEGKLIMRFDDTNPEKEKVDFEKVILEDLTLLQIYPDQFTHTSDYFDILLEMCEKLLNQNKAYVDDTEPEIMKKEREQRKVSKNRENSIEKNLNMWLEMLKGTAYGQKCCVRAKIDMNSDNGCLRDPTIYRCKNEPHPRTGSKYKVYPTYDFACPIVDSIEGVTHALRTMEYHDRDDQFNWFIEVLNLRKVHIWEYSRLNMMNTVLSKRKLTWFVDEKIVDSWEDPRLPTVRGVIRRGLTVEGLKQFIIAQGSSRTVVQMEWDKIWAFNKKIIDPISPRYTALKKGFTVLVNVKGNKTKKLIVPKHPKNPSLGIKEIWTGSNLLIEMSDAELLKEGDNATFINWGNLKITKINRDSKGSILSIDAETNLNDTNFKKTLKLTWLTNMENLTPVEIYYYDHIITKPILGKDEDFKKYVNYNSKNIINYIGEENLRNLEVGDVIQLQRIGFFKCDVPFISNGKVVLIHIPDGSNKSQLLNCSELNSKAFKSPSNFKENEELFLKNKYIDYKSLPISNQELEQIAFQWRNDRENLETQQKIQSIKENKKLPTKDQKMKESKKVIPNNNIDKSTINVAKVSRTRLGLEATKENNLAEWYSQVITKSELIEYYDVSGCYILRPWSFALWEVIQNFLDKEIKSLGVQNCYFPMFVTKSVLEREKTHIADFAPEVAWVTKSGESDLAEHIAIRPTSETVMYPAFAKWIQSYRDLPMKLNQWNNVVRWEFKHPQPFLRTREFLWQEGHTAYSSANEAQEEVYKVLEIYTKVYMDLLAVPVIKGWKTKKEKFAGSDFTTTVEAFISASGRGIQAATSHHLGQNFSKMFDIVFEDPDTKEKKFVFQNSWGLTTRSLGIMIMIHADNKGLVLPPNAAALQIVIIPCGITVNLKEEEKNDLLTACKTLEFDFCKAGMRAKFDERTNYSPGWKFNHWELKGVPVRVELGPKDMEKKQFVAVRRDTGEKKIFDFDNKVDNIKKLLNKIQENLFHKANEELYRCMIQSKDWNDFCSALDKKNIILAPFCEEESCEDNIKKDSVRTEEIETGAPAMGAKSLCIPFDQPSVIQNEDKCIHPRCKNKPLRYTLFGRSY